MLLDFKTDFTEEPGGYKLSPLEKASVRIDRTWADLYTHKLL
jgi:hypothetical protein